MTTLVEYIQLFPGHGGNTALVFQTLFRTFTWNYQELYRQVQKTAAFLDSLDVGRGDAVVVWGPNSPHWALLFMGALYRGAMAVPADLGSSPDFVSHIARETRAKAVFRSRAREDPPVDCPTLLLEDLLDDILPFHPQESPAEVGPDDVAQILYTSGTTGNPKGVVLTHRNLTSNLEGVHRAVVIDPDHLLVSILPLSHIFEQSIGFWTPLIHGGTVVHLQVIKPSELFRALNRFPVTAMAVVPQFLDLFRSRIQGQLGNGIRGKVFGGLQRGAEHLSGKARRVLFFQVHRRIGRSFRFFVAGGAPLDPELERFWNRMGFLILQGYGLTEASPVVALNSHQAHKIGSVGQPLPGMEVVIGDDEEVLARGDSVTIGYFNDPERTTETIRDGWLHTGDLGYMDEDGFLFLKGRKKDLIVTPAGLNVYPEDIEMVLHRLSGVKDAAVLEVDGKVHAALLLQDGVEAGSLVEQANASLAEHQRVQGYTVWPEDDFPRTTTNKPKKHEIKEILDQMAQGEAAAQPAPDEQAEGELERILVRISGRPASAVTPEARLGDDLGLDSIGRIELVGVLEEQLRAEVPEGELTDETTVQDLKELLGQGAGKPMRFARWSLSRAVSLARSVFQRLVIFPLFASFVRLRVEGLEHLEDVEGPVVFAPNHTSYLDPVAVLKALPPRLRDRVAPGQFAHFFDAPRGRVDIWLMKKFLFYFLTFAFNIFPLAQQRGVRDSFRYTGELIDKNWNIMLYPEGRRTQTGEMQPFLDGIGIVAGEMRVPVVPVHIQGLYEVLPPRRALPRRGSVTVSFGRPLEARKESYGDFTRRLEEAVRGLGSAES